ncbi:MAG: hypothetical protein SVY10_07210 [Thermodesulfobacteriota bacterium]|nr:hypothetical protein [Thermodesulfobacteriota bacterium]
MGKKRSPKNTGDKRKGESKSKERKKVFDTVESLIHREGEDRVSPEETNNAINELKSDSRAIHHLHEITVTEKYHIKSRIKALEILQDLGESIDEELYRFLKDAETLINEISIFLKDPSEELPPTICDHICQLSDNLKQAAIDQIIREEGEGSFPLLSQITGQDEELDLIIAGSLARLPVQKSSELLQKMSSWTENKNLRKSIKKSLFILREKGVDIEKGKSEDSQGSVLRPLARTSEGHLSTIDSLGDRLVWLALPRFPTGFYFFEVLLNDREGLKQFQGMEITKKLHSEFIQSFQEESPIPLVEADASYCRFLIEEAYTMAENGGYPVPEEYSHWKEKIKGPKHETQRPLIYTCLEEEAVQADEILSTRSTDLFDLPEFIDWIIPPDEVAKYTENVFEAERSKIVLSQFQKEERFSKIFNETVQELFDNERSLLYKRRLEEMAYVIYKLGKKDEAKICLKVALSIEDKGIYSFSYPFLLELVKRSLASAMMEEEEKEQEVPSLIVKP